MQKKEHTIQYSTVQYSTAQYSKVQYSTDQYNTLQYSTVHHLILTSIGPEIAYLLSCCPPYRYSFLGEKSYEVRFLIFFDSVEERGSAFDRF